MPPASVPDARAAGPSWVQIGTEGGVLPAPVTIAPQPVGYDCNRRDIVVLNVSNHSLEMGPAERADVIVDFSAFAGKTLILYNDSGAPIPAFDPRNDDYTGDPNQTGTGGAPPTLAGYGPNTRTIMQVTVASATPGPGISPTLGADITRLYATTQDKPIVAESAYNAPFPTISGTLDQYMRIQDQKKTFVTGDGNTVTNFPFQPKAIQELFELNYGRMNATLGTEVPNTTGVNQTTIPLGYAEPTTEVVSPSQVGQQIGVGTDGTQIWKITHNGVDTHAIHFHLFNVQLINRVGWDGAIRPPEANELGWKETVRMNPLEDAIVALRPMLPTLPFKVGDSVRVIDPTQPEGASLPGLDPITGAPANFINAKTNFGWEYVWHCHLLGHEENDMMRAIDFSVSPKVPSALAAVVTPGNGVPPKVTLNWTNNAVAPQAATNFTVQRATDAGFTQNVVAIIGPTGAPPAATLTDTTVTDGTTYFYRVRAENSVSYSLWTAGVTATVPLTPPTAFTAAMSLTAPLRITLNWTNKSSTATGVTIQRATNAAFTVGLQTVPLGLVTTYVDNTALAANTTYFYRIEATGAGTSVWVNLPSISTAIPAVPTALALTTTGASPAAASIRLTWTETGTATLGGFVIQRATNAGFNQNLTTVATLGPPAPTAPRSYVDSTVVHNQRYYYRINAFNGAGSSATSGSANITTLR